MGYSVRAAEDAGAPVLILENDIVPFTRVYSAGLARRWERACDYDNEAEAELVVREFLDENADQIGACFASLSVARQRTASLRAWLDAFMQLDPAMFHSRRLTFTRGIHLLEDAAHLEHAQKWEYAEIADLLQLRLGDLLFLETRNTTVPALPPGITQHTGERSLTRISWQGLKTARQLGGMWPADHSLVLIHDLLEGREGERIRGRQINVSADAWVRRHQQRFPEW
jgi:hypothetical protein